MKKDHRSSAIGMPAIPAEHQKSLRDALAKRGMLQRLHPVASPLENSIIGTAASLYEFFHSNGYQLSREEVTGNTVSAALSSQVAWIYAFYGEGDAPLYVGETKRTLKNRFLEHSKKQPWWPYWTKVKVLPCPDQTMRKIFESLLGLAGGYQANKTQPPGGDNLLDDLLLSLLALGNTSNQLPSFPNKMIFDHVEMVRQNLEDIGVK